jgi:hypothetical protein
MSKINGVNTVFSAEKESIFDLVSAPKSGRWPSFRHFTPLDFLPPRGEDEAGGTLFQA